jgi:hypothetical protein
MSLLTLQITLSAMTQIAQGGRPVITVPLSIDEDTELATRAFSLSHGLFRVPGYVASVRRGKTAVIVNVHGDNARANHSGARGHDGRFSVVAATWLCSHL